MRRFSSTALRERTFEASADFCASGSVTVTGHMGKPGTITLPEERFVELLVSAGRSLKAGGFTKIWFLGESGGNRTGMRTAAEKLNARWNGAATAS